MSARHVALLLALTIPGSTLAAGSLAVFPALGRPTLVTVTGRVVDGAPDAPAAPLQRNARRMLAKSREGADVSVTFAGHTRRVTTGDDGLFEATFAAPAHSPFPLGLQPVHAEADGAAGEGRVDVVSDAAPFLVLSDLDDTLAVSNVQSTRGLVASSLLEDERTQPAVEGMAELYRCLREGSDPAPGFAVVTGSPLEYGPRVEAFLARGGFPFAALHLRHLGLKTMSGYKEPILRSLLSRFPQRVVLVGDSGEQDPEVYARIRSEFPGRVAAIFIRDAGRSADPARFADMVLFQTAAEAARAAASRGLLAPACADRAFPRPPPLAAPAPTPPAPASPPPPPSGGLHPFTTDGCSLFPDRDPIRNLSWRECCVAHDMAYWRGGTEPERLQADETLRACVAQRTGDAHLADLMFHGVRAGGAAEFPTWYRWGYGWSYGRLYAPLTEAERALADAELARWKQGQR